MGRRRKSDVQAMSIPDMPDSCQWDELAALVRAAAGGCQEILVCCGGVCRKIATICPEKKGSVVELIVPYQAKGDLSNGQH